MSARSEFDAFADARAVADAVLYEGYVLYPYRASARKNQMRWQFGVIVPPRSQETDGSERSSMRTECIVDPGARTVPMQAVLPPGARRTSNAAAADERSGAERWATDELDAGGSRLVP